MGKFEFSEPNLEQYATVPPLSIKQTLTPILKENWFVSYFDIRRLYGSQNDNLLRPNKLFTALYGVTYSTQGATIIDKNQKIGFRDYLLLLRSSNEYLIGKMLQF